MSTRKSKGTSRRVGRPRSIPSRRSTRALHRLATVRQQQGISSRTVARQLQADVREVHQQEDEHTDLNLSELYDWQRVLDVPIADLLVDPGTSLSQPVQQRAQLVRVMKSALTIQNKAKTPAQLRLAETLVNQLVEIMPELAEISPWHTVGHRRRLEEYGRIVEQRIPDDVFCPQAYE